jgi:DDE superfamily endonuclease
MGAFYEAFAAEQARQLVRRLEFRYTPKHGSWLHSAENELSVLTRQCLHDRRFGNTKQLAAETAAWSTSSNEKQRGVDWQFTDANGICGQCLRPPIEDAIKRLCNQFG